MSIGYYRTVTRRTPFGWLAIRMCIQEEVCRAEGATKEEARYKLACKMIAKFEKKFLGKVISLRNPPP